MPFQLIATARDLLAKENFIIRRVAAAILAGEAILGIRLGFHDHAREEDSIGLVFQQPAAHQARSDDFGRTAEEGVGQGWEIIGDGLGSHGSGLARLCGQNKNALTPKSE